jgi:hypothetical protein
MMTVIGIEYTDADYEGPQLEGLRGDPKVYTLSLHINK